MFIRGTSKIRSIAEKDETEQVISEYRSRHTLTTKGPDPTLHKGPSETLLL